MSPLVHGENALFVEPGDVPRLSAAIERLDRDAELRSTIATGAAELAPQFAWDRIARTSVEAYERLLAARPMAAG